jgi:hypothetical protein
MLFRTGESCTTTGVYHCGMHGRSLIEVRKGEKFPPCRCGMRCGLGMHWLLLNQA